MEPTLKVSIWRGRDDGGFAQYDVPRRDSQTVLDVVTHVQRHLEPTLSYRFACRVGMCGSCAMTVNGKARWTCRTHVSKVVGADGALEIAPLANLPVIKDLATDMSVFFDKWARPKGRFVGNTTRHDDFATVSPASPRAAGGQRRHRMHRLRGLLRSCDVVQWRPDYLGPAALNRAWTLVNDVRDVQQVERLRAVAGDAGCHCPATRRARAPRRCPKQIAPTLAIAGLKRGGDGRREGHAVTTAPAPDLAAQVRRWSLAAHQRHAADALRAGPSGGDGLRRARRADRRRDPGSHAGPLGLRAVLRCLRAGLRGARAAGPGEHRARMGRLQRRAALRLARAFGAAAAGAGPACRVAVFTGGL
jgi:fumarate reductase iron-sulfur subunit